MGLVKSRNSRTIFEGIYPRNIAGSAGVAPAGAPAGGVPADWGEPIKAERVSGVAMPAGMFKLIGPAKDVVVPSSLTIADMEAAFPGRARKLGKRPRTDPDPRNTRSSPRSEVPSALSLNKIKGIPAAGSGKIFKRTGQTLPASLNSTTTWDAVPRSSCADFDAREMRTRTKPPSGPEDS